MTACPHVRIFVNGKPIRSDRVVSFPFHEDKIFVFETLKSYRGNIFCLAEHLDRLRESANTVGFELPKPLRALENELKHSLEPYRNRDLILRLLVDERDSYLLILERKRPARIYEVGVRLQASVVRRNLANAEPPQAKSNAFLNNALARFESLDSDAFDALFLDSDGYVTEATVWNLFTVKENQLRTPQTGILNGVTREFVIKCAEQEGLPVLESNLTRHDVWNADEAFLTNTSGEMVPIRSLDGRSIGKHIPGTVTQRLMLRFLKALGKELKRI